MDNQQDLLKKEKELKTVESYEFDMEPIRGYPELRWAGKRPFRSTVYYPAQLKETHGSETKGWMNELYWGDNLQVMSHMLKKYRGKVDLIYIDPPYDSKAEYKKKIDLKGKSIEGEISGFEEKQYNDIWTNDEYLQFIYERIVIIRELLSENGTIIIQCDWHRVHQLRCLMDEIFGNVNIINEIIWHYKTFQGQVRNYFARKHDNLLFYKKGESFTYNKLFDTPLDETIDAQRWLNYIDENGKIFAKNMPTQDSRFMRYLNKWIKNNGREPMDNDVVFEVKGQPLDSVWDLKGLDPKSDERLDYPTQKPEALLERIIKASTNPGDLVFDCFMGSGTTQAVAMKLGRRFIGADINLGAIQTATKRLVSIQQDLAKEDGQVELDFANSKGEENAEEKNTAEVYSGFHVYTVNDYDIFRNPVQAKEILREALEIDPMTTSNVFDGEKDGYLVKIMPVNRIATKEDLNEIISNLNYREFEKRQKEKPNKPVERIQLVCMGHDPELKAELEKQAHPYKIEVQVVDILRDRSDLRFKREAEAKVSIKGSGKNKKLVIENFYPLNLMQKLSMEKTSVKKWQELVETVMIDFYYDGAVLNPTVVNIPEKNELVKGEYAIPEDHGVIRVKITDLISESLEITVAE